MQYTAAELLVHAKEVRDDGAIIEIVVWRLPKPVSPCNHPFKYRLFYGWPGRPVIRYDNERGKGDHRHVDGTEQAYQFLSVDRLLDDFERDLSQRGHP